MKTGLVNQMYVWNSQFNLKLLGNNERLRFIEIFVPFVQF